MSSFFPGAGEVSVLIVDDDEVSREVLATICTIEGFEVRTARDGVNALEVLDSNSRKPQVILMDLQMPGLNGAGLISKLRERVRLGSGTMLLAMSASEPKAEEVKGTDGFLRKPFGAKELKRFLEDSEREVAGHRKDPEVSDYDADYKEDKSYNAAETREVILDRNKLKALRALMPEASVRQVYTTALDDLSRRMPVLEDAIAHGNAKMVCHIGHAIKGGCGMIGAVYAAKLGAQLETEGDKLDNGPAIAAQLRSAIEALKGMLDEEFPRR